MTTALIDLADEETWPAQVRSALDDGFAMLSAFEAVRTAIDRRMRTNIQLRINPPDNPHADARAALIGEIDSALNDADIVAWHCTRLLPSERTSILANGLRRHSGTMFEGRIAEAVSTGHLAGDHGDALLTSGQVADDNRDDRLWLIINRLTLGDEHAVGDFLRNWGGEAIYNSAGCGRRDQRLKIGTSAIVEAVLPINLLGALSWSIGEQMVVRYLDARDIRTEHSWGTDIALRRDLPATSVHRIIGPGDPAFEQLTEASGWDRRL